MIKKKLSKIESGTTQNRIQSHGEGKKFFPDGFMPRTTDVIISKGTKFFNHIGNIRFRKIIASRYDDYYSDTVSRQKKSRILSSIVDQIRTNGGIFIKYDPGHELWFEVDDALARDKISQAFRNTAYQKNNRDKNNDISNKNKKPSFKDISSNNADHENCQKNDGNSNKEITNNDDIRHNFNLQMSQNLEMEVSSLSPSSNFVFEQVGSDESLSSLSQSSLMSFWASIHSTDTLDELTSCIPDNIFEEDSEQSTGII